MPKWSKAYPQSFMTDAVAYANEHGDSEALVQFGVSMASLGMWKKKYLTPSSVPKYKQMKEVVKSKINKSTRSVAVKANKYDEEESILLDWLGQSMILNQYPSMGQIGERAKELGLRASLHGNYGSRGLVRRSHLYRQWSAGAKLRGRNFPLIAPIKMESSMEDAGVSSGEVENSINHKMAASANHEDEISQNFGIDDAANSEINEETKHRMKNEAKRIIKRARIAPINKAMEAKLEAWVSQCIDSHRRPTLRAITVKGQEIAGTNRIKNRSSFKSWAENFLRRHNLTERWRKSLYEEKNNAKPAEVQNDNAMEAKLEAWVSQCIDNCNRPTLRAIILKGQEIAGHDLTKYDSSSTSWAEKFLRRHNLTERWRKSLYEEKINAKPAEVQNDNAVEAKLEAWVSQCIDSHRRPTLRAITLKGHEIAGTNTTKSRSSLESWAEKFLRRHNLTERWRKSLHEEKNNAKSAEVQNDKAMEAKLEAWVSQCIDSHRRPTLRAITVKGQEIAGHNLIKNDSSSKSWAEKFLRRRNLTKRWRKSLYEEKNNAKPAESFHSGIEEEILAWIKNEYPDGDLPPQQMFLDKAQEVACKLEIQDFTATDRWFQLFMERNQHLNETSPALPLSPSDGRQSNQSNQMQQSVTSEEDGSNVPSSSHYPTTNGQVGMFGYSPIIADVHTSPVKVKRESWIDCQAASLRCALASARKDIDAENSVTPRVSNSHGGILTVKRGFGSFHSSNLDEQLKFADSASYSPQQMPVRPPSFEEYSSSPFIFGSTARKKHFYFEQGCIFLNHGAFGGTLKEALDYYHDWQRYAESQPLRFFDRILFPQIVHAQKRLANFIGCKAADIALTSNVTTAINAVLQGLTLNEDSSIYYLDVTYGAVKKMIKHICLRTGAKAIEIKVTLPISNSQDIVSLVRSTLKNGTTLAVFDHIPSNYAFIMPVRELTSVAHQKGVPVLIDGAHGLGQLHLDLTILGADYYAGNCHKWFCAPKGCAFLYVNKQLQRYTRGLTISHGYDEGFHSQFTWTGAKDYCSYLSLHALINFWTVVGPDKIRQYCKSLLKKVVDYFSTKWDAELLAPLECHGMMCCISLPSVLFSGKAQVSYADAEAIQNRLYSDFDIEVPIKCIENRLYVRISAHIYNEFPEYASLASALLAIANPAS